jgi:hypothetical protein
VEGLKLHNNSCTVVIVGVFPGILLHNPAGMGTNKSAKKVIPSPEDEALASAYWTEDHSSLALPSFNLYRGLVDYVELKSALKDAPLSEISLLEGELEVKLREINETIDAMVAQYRALKYDRTMAYIQQIKSGNLDRARELSSKGDANVVFKLLERYSYTELLRALKKFKKERGELTHADVKDVSKVVSTALQQSIKDRLDSKIDQL